MLNGARLISLLYHSMIGLGNAPSSSKQLTAALARQLCSPSLARAILMPPNWPIVDCSVMLIAGARPFVCSHCVPWELTHYLLSITNATFSFRPFPGD